VKKTRQFMATVASAMAVAALLSTSAFAETRHRDETWRDDSRNDNRGEYRENQRGTFEGHISSLNRDRDGYRVQLDRGGYSFWVPESHVRNRQRDFRVGASIRLGGIFRGGSIFVDVVDWPNDGRYNDDRYNDGRYNDGRYRDNRSYDRGYLRGVVERVDYRRGVVEVRESSTGRFVTVDMDRRSSRGVDLSDLRRGDAVTFAGDWRRGNVFEAYSIESVRSGRRR